MDGVQHTKGECMALGIKLNVFLVIKQLDAQNLVLQ